MRRIWTCAMLCGLMVAIGGSAAEEPRREADKAEEDPKLTEAWKQLEGCWKRTGFIHRGNVSEVHVWEPVYIIEIRRDGVITYLDGKIVYDESNQRFEIDPSKSPAHLDILMLTGNPDRKIREVVKAIYQVKGDTLRCVINQFGKERPTAFDFPADDPERPMLTELKRTERPQVEKK